MDVGEIVPDHRESLVDSCESSMAPRETTSGMGGGDSSRDDPQKAEGIHFGGGPSTDSPELEQHDVLHRDANDSGSQIVIRGVDQLRDAIERSQLSRVVELKLSKRDIASGYALVARALASGKMSVLQRLSLYNAGLTGDICVTICDALTPRNCPSLTSINFGSNRTESQGVEVLGRAIASRNWLKLKSLRLLGTGIDDDSMVTLATAFQSGESSVMPNLKNLCLSFNSFTAVGMQQFAEVIKSGRLKSLEQLDLGNNELGDVGMQHVAEALTSCNLEKSTHLSLFDTGMSDKGMARLANAFQSGETSMLPNLKDLCLEKTSFTAVGMQHLAEAIKSGGLKSLERLDLGNNELGDVGMQHVAEALTSCNLEKSTHLSLFDTGMSDKGMARLANAFQSGETSMLPNLKDLCLEKTSFTAVGMQHLAEAIKSGGLKSLERLDLGNNELGDVGMQHVAEALTSCNLEKSTHLSLVDTGMSDKGMAKLANAFQSGETSMLPNLKDLCLEKTSFTAVGMQQLAEVIKSGRLKSLKWLDLGHNELGDVGMQHVAEALTSHNLEKLISLDLDDTRMNDKSVAVLAKALQHGDAIVLPNLKYLRILGNFFTEVGLQHVAEVLKSGRLNSLQFLYLDDGDLSEECKDILVSALIKNRNLTLGMGREPTFYGRVNRIRELNTRRKKILEGLLSSPMVPATSGKVYLCGNPEVGKTTLSKSLQRTFLQSMWTWESHEEERTRGIDVAQISSKGADPITLHLWDMAGQEEYHLVHHSFFADLDEAKATTFVVVCTSENLDKSEEQLKYWLQFIASSCDRTTQNLRHVFVVLNNKIQNNRQEDQNVNRYAQRWQKVLEAQREKFTGLLEVEPHLFWIDVRARQSVLGLKKCLLEHSRNVLRTKQVPELCQNLQKYLFKLTETRKQFPIIHWEEFMVNLEQEPSLLEWSEQIGAGIKYLNEVGVLIDVDKRSTEDGDIPSSRLLVLDPNWICRSVIGNMLLSEDMVRKTEGEAFLREHVNKTTGAISIEKVKTFFHSLLGGWNDSQFNDLISILLWLGLCYKGRDGNVYIPSLVDKKAELADEWQPSSLQGHARDSWVMGFSLQREESDKTLAPMSLWHKFQVGLAQTCKFNGPFGNSFTAGKTFVTFTVDLMHVLIKVDAREDIPTFDEITIFVKPISSDKWDRDIRMQSQVDLADDLLNILLQQWGTICPTVRYVCKVVRPWPACQPRPKVQKRTVLQVTEAKRLVQEKGFGTHQLGYCTITCDQLLSTNDKKDLIKAVQSAVQSKITIVNEALREAVDLGIYPPELKVSQITLDAGEVPFQSTGVSNNGISSEESELTSYQVGKAGHNMSQADQTLQAIQALEKKVVSEVREARREVVDKVDKVANHLNEIKAMLQEGFSKVLREQEKVFGKLQETQSFLIEEKHRTCPNLIYLGEEDSGRWAKLKQVLSSPFSVNVRLQFACEAMHSTYEPHKVRDQEGIRVSSLHPVLRKIAPWLKVSLTIFLTSAKIAAHVVVPGLGMILPDMSQLQQAASLLNGIALATGYVKDELDNLMRKEIGLDANPACWNPQDLYGKSRAAITKLIGELQPQDYMKKLGLRKVCLKYSDGSFRGVVWICEECLRKFTESDLVTEV